MDGHNREVRKIQKQVKYFYRQKQKVRIYHGSTNSTRLLDFQKDRIVDTSQLNHVIEVNTAHNYALVEPSVPMDQLVEATLKHGLLPPVVMEFPGITVGGGIQGGAAESSSFKYGGFHESAIEYEMVLGDGRKLTVSRSQNADLFWGTAGTYGSLGIITLVKLRLVPAGSYVKLAYHKVGSYQQAIHVVEESVSQSVDFVDGILYSTDTGVVMIGTFAQEANGPIARFSKPWHEWFYLHARKIVWRHDAYEEYIPIRDYLFRYDRGAFWMGRQGFKLFRVPFNRITRYLLDHFMHTRILYRALQATTLSQRYIIQDVCLPKASAQSFLGYVTKQLGIFPLWLLPLKPNHQKLDICGLSFTDDPLVVNVGVWGASGAKTFADFETINRDMEQEITRLGARKTLYAHAYYTPEEFWRLFDKAHYDKLRQKYKAEVVFDDIYTKVAVKKAYHLSPGKAIRRFFRPAAMK